MYGGAFIGPLKRSRRGDSASYAGQVKIRPAAIADVPAMHRVINDAAEFGLMLHKSFGHLYENLREFQVAEDAAAVSPANPTGVIGVCGLSIIWADLAEVVSLAVDAAHRGRGLGGALTQACLDEAHALGIRRVMSLTYEQAFFERLGFAVVNRGQLPMKVWADCVRCPKNQACDEIAMMRTFTDLAPLPDIPRPPQPASLEVPVTLTNSVG